MKNMKIESELSEAQWEFPVSWLKFPSAQAAISTSETGEQEEL